MITNVLKYFFALGSHLINLIQNDIKSKIFLVDTQKMRSPVRAGSREAIAPRPELKSKKGRRN